MKEITIKGNDAGQRLDRFISKALPLLPESLLQKYIRLKRIKVNGKGAKRDTRLVKGDILQLYINDEFFDKPKEENSYLKVGTPKLNIVYEDENIMLLDKKPGILCHSSGVWDYNTLIANVQAYLAQKKEWRPKEENSFAPALCNRIDRNTGGIVIAAKNAQALRIINEKIQLREIDKFYLCAVSGRPTPPAGKLSNYLLKDDDKNLVSVKKQPVDGAKLAETEYRLLTSKGRLSLVECHLLTGRTHQIRVQMAKAGWPLLGDTKYGNPSVNRRFEEKGQALYSYKLCFDFKTDAGILEYLNGKEFKVQKVDFAEKYFGVENLDF